VSPRPVMSEHLVAKKNAVVVFKE